MMSLMYVRIYAFNLLSVLEVVLKLYMIPTKH